MKLTIPNAITIFRLVLIPFFIGIFYLPIHFVDQVQQNKIATAIFMIAGISDWLDGYLARKLNQSSDFGAFLDPVVDKLMVASALIALVQLDRLDAVIAIIIIFREISISALREWMAKVGASSAVAVSSAGKLKTVMQLVAIPFMLLESSGPLYITGYFLIIVAATLTVSSMIQYCTSAFVAINRKRKFPIKRPT